MAPRSPMSPVLLSLTQPVAGSTSCRDVLECRSPERRLCEGTTASFSNWPVRRSRQATPVTVLLAGVTNPAAQTVSDFTVATSQDQLASTAAPYAITVSESAGISVTTSPATVGALSTYTLSNIVVGSAGCASWGNHRDRYDD